jgi:hypothetical protein
LWPCFLSSLLLFIVVFVALAPLHLLYALLIAPKAGAKLDLEPQAPSTEAQATQRAERQEVSTPRKLKLTDVEDAMNRMDGVTYPKKLEDGSWVSTAERHRQWIVAEDEGFPEDDWRPLRRE